MALSHQRCCRDTLQNERKENVCEAQIVQLICSVSGNVQGLHFQSAANSIVYNDTQAVVDTSSFIRHLVLSSEN